MLTLFPSEIYPEGFSYHPGFISEAEEKILLEEIAQTELHHLIFHGYEARRKVASFGYDWSFVNRKLSKGKNIPEGFLPLVEKVIAHEKLDPSSIAELLVTAYPEGSVINWHRDAAPFDLIAGISLLSSCTFRLRPYPKEKQGRSSIINITVAPRSLYIMKGAARSEWEHSIQPVDQLRYSITLRTLKAGAHL